MQHCICRAHTRQLVDPKSLDSLGLCSDDRPTDAWDTSTLPQIREEQ